ncbi:lysosome-associated membrane glycoprotein 1-like [Branchiostoma floridae]|uniref:Lysosome-associated membrane glycoprotein 1-like n=1 Tax=Branchiostoma floridae TaxID=7739 RepID=A0A9J7N267_BRAFL|nr:lysosome-associated membrane glycoprotein 1-like [Branchiostoma floridae]
MLGLLARLVLLAGSIGTASCEATSDPLPPVGHFYVENGRGQKCLLLDISATFHVEYLRTDNTTDTVAYPLPNNSYVSGTCAHGFLNEQTAVMNISFDDITTYMGQFGMNLTFSRNLPVMTHFWLSKVSIYYQLIPSLFPDALHPNMTFLSVVSGIQAIKTQSTALTPKSYLCKREQELTLSQARDVNVPLRANLTVHNIQAQPFEVDTQGTFSLPQECPQDFVPTTEPPATSTTPFQPVTPSLVFPVGSFSLNNSEGQVCLLANMGVLFRVAYRVDGGKNRNATYVLPANSSVGGSCEDDQATLTLMFTDTFNLSLSFYSDGKRYVLNSLVVGYQRSARFFPNAQDPNTSDIQLENDLSLLDTELGKSYRCDSQRNFTVGQTVTLEIVDMQVQPFGVEGGRFSDAARCPQDLRTTMYPVLNATTTVPTRVTTTMQTTDATDTLAPATTILPSSPPHSTPPYTTTPPPTPSKPTKPLQGHYVVKNSTGQVCLLANMGVQFIVEYVKQDAEVGQGVFNVPVTAAVSGACQNNVSSLTLEFYNATFCVTFTFVQSIDRRSGRYRLASAELSYTEFPVFFPQTIAPNQQRRVENMTLNVFSTDVRKSYKCLADVNVTVTKEVTMLVRQVQLQPFHVDKSGKFFTAEDCAQTGYILIIVILASTLPATVLVIATISCICWRRRRRTEAEKEPLFKNFIE